MARISNKQSEGIVILVILVLVIGGIGTLIESIGLETLFTLLAIVIAAFFTARYLTNKAKRKLLMNKYRDKELVDAIMKKTAWVGQTAEQLIDSFGKPQDIDQKVLKTKKKEIWKYQHKGGNRYGLRVILENDIVAGWEEKS